jgi:hypothetical protein
MATLTEGATILVDAERVFAVWAVGGMAGEVLYDIELIVAGWTANGVDRIELDTAGHLMRQHGRCSSKLLGGGATV